MYSFVAVLAAGSALSNLAVYASRLTPPVVPLTVRNPYLSTWLSDARDPPWTQWPMFWTGERVGFSVLASVPEASTVYPLVGRPHDSLPNGNDEPYTLSYCKFLGLNFDASTTNLTYLIPAPSAYGAAAKPVEVVLSFLSPITPTSTLRQSIPASYLTVEVKGDFAIDIYLDLNGQWVSGNRANEIVWDLHQDELANGKALKTWRVKRRVEQLLSEFKDQAEWGTLHFTGPSDVRHESGTSAILRQRFSRTGTLQDANDNDFRGIMDDEPVFAFAKSFSLNASSSSNESSSESIMFTIAHIQDPVAQFASARGLTMMRPLWSSWFSSVESLLAFHFLDYDNAYALAANYSNQLAEDASKTGAEDYLDVCALTARQVMGATSFSGTPDDPILWLKEISSNGNFQTIDVIFPAFPFFMYTNPRWLAYMLEPLIEHTLSGQYPNSYAMHDLGTHFPNATGHPDGNDEYMPVEECGNILIMGLAIVNSLKYEQSASSGSVWSSLGSESMSPNPKVSAFGLNNLESRDGIWGLDDRWGGSSKGDKQARKWVERSYKLWKSWTGYLVEFSLRPHNQLSTDDFAGPLPLQTNLALKGIIGINAMADIAATIGNDADYKYFKNISTTYISKWESYSTSRDGTHAQLTYEWYGSWTTLYNLFTDALLCFHIGGHPSPATGKSTLSQVTDGQKPLEPSHPPSNSSSVFVPLKTYSLQSTYYNYVLQQYGLPLDSRHLYTKSDWAHFSAAVVSSSTKRKILQAKARWLNETSTDRPMTDLHETEGTGGFPGVTFMARPVVGGHFAPLALDRACGGEAAKGLEWLDDEEKAVMRQKEEVAGEIAVENDEL